MSTNTLIAVCVISYALLLALITLAVIAQYRPRVPKPPEAEEPTERKEWPQS